MTTAAPTEIERADIRRVTSALKRAERFRRKLLADRRSLACLITAVIKQGKEPTDLIVQAEHVERALEELAASINTFVDEAEATRRTQRRLW